jgi:hypothetical protein
MVPAIIPVLIRIGTYSVKVNAPHRRHYRQKHTSAATLDQNALNGTEQPFWATFFANRQPDAADHAGREKHYH